MWTSFADSIVGTVVGCHSSPVCSRQSWQGAALRAYFRTRLWLAVACPAPSCVHGAAPAIEESGGRTGVRHVMRALLSAIQQRANWPCLRSREVRPRVAQEFMKPQTQCSAIDSGHWQDHLDQCLPEKHLLTTLGGLSDKQGMSGDSRNHQVPCLDDEGWRLETCCAKGRHGDQGSSQLCLPRRENWAKLTAALMLRLQGAGTKMKGGGSLCVEVVRKPGTTWEAGLKAGTA